MLTCIYMCMIHVHLYMIRTIISKNPVIINPNLSPNINRPTKLVLLNNLNRSSIGLFQLVSYSACI